MSVTNGLIPFLIQQHGVDTTYMADFIRGFQETLKAGTDPKLKAYAAGMDIANQVQERMLPSLANDFVDSPDSIITSIFLRGFSDALANDSTYFTQKAAETYFRQKHETDMAAKQEKLYGANRDAGRKFLEENAKRDSVVTLPSGLQYQILVKGEGEVPQASDKVKWTEALTMMPVGSKWRLFIPSELAYGDRDTGAIKPYSTLIFDVELVEIVKK